MENPTYQTTAARLINDMISEKKTVDKIWEQLINEGLVVASEEAHQIMTERYTLWHRAFAVGFCGLSCGTTISNYLKDIGALTEKGSKLPSEEEDQTEGLAWDTPGYEPA